jgi:hypothetical protein
MVQNDCDHRASGAGEMLLPFIHTQMMMMAFSGVLMSKHRRKKEKK